MKVALLCLSLIAVCLSSCTTLENRRDMYCGYGHVCGPYTCGDLTPVKPKVPAGGAGDYKGVVK